MPSLDPHRFDTTLRYLTTPALLIVLALPLLAWWNAIGWGTVAKLVATTVLVWFACAVIAALICRPRG